MTHAVSSPAALVVRHDTKLLRMLARWRRNHRSRRQLANLEPHHLKDIGLIQSEASREAKRWFWDSKTPSGRNDLPSNWGWER